MSIINKLTYRHLKSNFKRTIITLMGIIISVAMVTAVFTSCISFLNFFKNMSAMYDGHYYSRIDECTYDNIDTLLKRDDVKNVSACETIGEIDSDKDSNSLRNVSGVLAVTDNFYNMFNLHIDEGRVPKAANEIVVAQSYIDKNKLNWNIGDEITVPYINALSESGEYSEKTFTICGITTASVSQTDHNSIFSYLDKDANSSKLSLYILNTELNNSIWDTMKDDAKSIGKDNVTKYNTEYFSYSGIMEDNATFVALGVFVGIILAIIIVASVFMIYDSFAVSFQQRSRYLGMLASVGATRHQKRSSIYFEGFLLGIIGIPIGIIAGIGGIAVTFKAIEPLMIKTIAIPVSEALTVHVNWVVVLFSVLISTLTIFISAYIPARRASKTTAIEAIRQNNTVTVSSRKLRKSKFAGKFFGYEGALASKNYKRNGKRNRSITAALSISVILFLTVTNFSSILTGFINNNYEMPDYDIYVSVPMKYADNLEQKFDNVSTVNYFDGYSQLDAITTNTKDMLNSDITKLDDSLKFNVVSIYAIDNEKFNEYATALGINAKDYYDKENPKGIMFNSIVLANTNGKKRQTVAPFNNVEGKTLDATYDVFDSTGENKKTSKTSLTIGKQTSKEVKDLDIYSNNVAVIYPFETIASIVPDIANDENFTVSYGVKAANHDDAYTEIDDYLAEKAIPSSIFDQTSQMQTMNALNSIAMVFGYGFITLITLISIMNIINTISTSMEERRREFAMIKSVGLTPKSFKKMIYLESAFYGIKSLFWGIPVSFLLNYLMYKAMAKSFDYGFNILWQAYLAAIIAVFAVIAIALIYSTTKIKHDNIIETLKNDDI